MEEFEPPEYEKHLYCDRDDNESDNVTVESQPCDSIPIDNDCNKSNKSNNNDDDKTNDNHCDDESSIYDEDDNSTICSNENISVKSNSCISRNSSHQQKDIFYLRVPKIKNKNFHITMNQYYEDNNDNRSICSHDKQSIKSNSNLSRTSSHKQKDIFYLRVPKIKNKNFHITACHPNQQSTTQCNVQVQKVCQKK